MAEPNASDEDLKKAAEKAGILDEVMALPKQFDTPIKDYSTLKLSGGFRQGLCLARAYLRDASIMLLDEPATMLDNKADQRLIKTLEESRGKVTIMMVTHRPSHLERMDKIFLLQRGQLVMQGPPQDVIPKIPPDLI